MSRRARGSSRPRRAAASARPSSNKNPDGATNAQPGPDALNNGPAPAEPNQPAPAANAGTVPAPNTGTDPAANSGTAPVTNAGQGGGGQSPSEWRN